jgi:PAS domain S-box-containing protein
MTDKEAAKYFLAAIVESSQDSIVTVDFDNIITTWNKGAENLYGYTADEAIGRPLMMLNLPENLAAVLTNTEHVRNSREVVRYDMVRIHKDGRDLHLDILLSPVKNEAGEVIGVSTFARDNTERLKAMAATRFQAQLLNTVSQAVIATDNEGRITYWNAYAAEMYGWSADEIVGQMLQDFLLPDAVLDEAAEIVEQVKRGKHWGGEFLVQRRDGTRFPAQVYNAPIVNEAGEVQGIVGVSTDITERKALERQKDDFIGVASHELRTPVTSIRAFADLLHDSLQHSGDTASAQLVLKLNQQVNRLSGLISNLLDTTHLTEGGGHFSQELFDPRLLIEETAYAMQLSSRTHIIEWDLEPLPMVMGDKSRIQLVLSNLLTNAIKYSPQADRVLIHAEAANGRLTVSVQDFGIGVNGAIKQRIFERFFRASDGSISTFPGLGLGLYIASEIVKRHGGDMWVESELGKGSTFFFTLPTA